LEKNTNDLLIAVFKAPLQAKENEKVNFTVAYLYRGERKGFFGLIDWCAWRLDGCHRKMKIFGRVGFLLPCYGIYVFSDSFTMPNAPVSLTVNVLDETLKGDQEARLVKVECS
jgi:hypothetical protein